MSNNLYRTAKRMSNAAPTQADTTLAVAVDSLIALTLNTGVTFNEDSPETHKAMFAIAAARAEVLRAAKTL